MTDGYISGRVPGIFSGTRPLFAKDGTEFASAQAARFKGVVMQEICDCE